MNLRRNEPRRFLCGGVGALCLLFLYPTLQAQVDHPATEGRLRIIRAAAKVADRQYRLPDPSSASYVVVCDGDTLRPGADFRTEDSLLVLEPNVTPCDSLLQISYRNYEAIGKPHFLHEFLTSNDEPAAEPAVVTEPVRSEAASPNLEVSGTKTFYADVSDRGNTNLSQGLAMTIAGNIGHGVVVRGSFSDRGLRDNRLVTKRFSELENVYLQVESDRLSGIFGNYELKEDRFRFLTMRRTVQGLGLKYRLGASTLESSASVPPGNYAEYTLTTTDGNYGPYRLQGKNGESGIAVIDNSETVWFNGAKLTRGRDQDYYLDYPRGELYFTGRQAVDDQDRVRVEFEYQKLEYRKTLLTGVSSNPLPGGKGKIDIGYAGLISASSDPLDFALDKEEIDLLKMAGDDVGKTILSGASRVDSGSGDYALESDSLSDTIYVYVGDGKGDYRVSFRQVEHGDYTYLGAGRYQFVGGGKGSYLPQKQLPLPEELHIADIAGEYRLTERLALSTEAALSYLDRNRFSKRDDGDNTTAAGFLRLQYASKGGSLLGNASVEYLPQRFGRLGRLDYTDEAYVWQRRSADFSDRQRYLADVSGHVGRYDHSRLDLGFTKEKGGFESAKTGFAFEIKEWKRSTLQLDLTYTASKDTLGDNRLFGVKPLYTTNLLPVRLTARGEYDNRRNSNRDSAVVSDSKREVELGLAYGGLEVIGRQRENWQMRQTWRLLDSKKSLLLVAQREFRGRRKVRLNIGLNRYTQTSRKQEYQTGALDLDLPNTAGFVDLAANLRLNRKGTSQTNRTYLKVDEGMGDYVLIDSVYVPQTRGDYIRLTESVGSSKQAVEAEKRIQLEFNLARLARSPIVDGTSVRYEVTFREIGDEGTRLAPGWLVPPLSFFPTGARFAQRRHEYHLRRYEEAIRLRNELEFIRRRDIDLLDVSRASRSLSDQGQITLRKLVGQRDFLELTFLAENSLHNEIDRYSLAIKKRKLRLSGSRFQGAWEFGLAVELGKEKSDSSSLNVSTYRLVSTVKYNLMDRGRVELSTFMLYITESRGQRLLLQMADGFPTGTNLGGNLRAEFEIAGNVSFSLTATEEVRHGEKNRYFLRTELVSRFQ